MFQVFDDTNVQLEEVGRVGTVDEGKRRKAKAESFIRNECCESLKDVRQFTDDFSVVEQNALQGRSLG